MTKEEEDGKYQGGRGVGEECGHGGSEGGFEGTDP